VIIDPEVGMGKLIDRLEFKSEVVRRTLSLFAMLAEQETFIRNLMV
jgi:hypothetical protein